MIRFILKRRQKLVCGVEIENFYHIDNSVFQLEKALRNGGFAEDTYDCHSLVGVELLDDDVYKTSEKA